jgi:hypothetical protein
VTGSEWLVFLFGGIVTPILHSQIGSRQTIVRQHVGARRDGRLKTCARLVQNRVVGASAVWQAVRQQVLHDSGIMLGLARHDHRTSAVFC